MTRFACAVFVCTALGAANLAEAATPQERLQLDRLRATHEAVLRFATQRHAVPADSGFRDIRAVLHVHSSLSYDSRAPLEEILTAAKKVGVNAILFTEHPSPRFDYFSDGHQGMRDGVLMVPGAETEGLLLYPTHSMAGEQPQGEQQARAQVLVDRTVRGGGLAFLSHLEARMNWKLDHLSGSEIYNTHADLKQDGYLLDLLTSPLGLAASAASLTRYPQEVFASIQDYPADYLRRYDELCQGRRLTGVAACDAHHNQVYRIVTGDSGGYDVIDFQGKRLAQVPEPAAAALRLAFGKRRAGAVVWQADLDPYERTLRHVSTHLLVDELTRAGVWSALENGRAYVAFDWMADPTGFVCQAQSAGKRHPLGSELALAAGLLLRVACPLECQLRLLRDGHEIATSEGREAKWPIIEPGVYRVEAWLKMPGERRPWILANPIYVRPAGWSASGQP